MSSLENESSLLALSIAAANAVPIPIPQGLETTTTSNAAANSFNGNGGASSGSHAASGKAHNVLKHRRLSSTGQMKRRMSDAREAASRPSAATLQNGAAALNALATLSLAGSPPPQAVPQTSTSFASAVGTIGFNPVDAAEEQSIKQEDQDFQGDVTTTAASADVSVGGITIKNVSGKKRGTTFQCESCSKVYRHPSCLIKHRWEHSPHWREASKFMLSKHQQVQMLEAAAILSHLSPSNNGGTSLPEDRSLWPSYLSGGALPPPSSAHSKQPPAQPIIPSSHGTQPSYRVSSSVPTQSAQSLSLSGSAGPRMHDYSIPSASGITHVRPGVVGVSTGNSPAHTPAPSHPMPLPVNRSTYRDVPRGMSVSSDVLESPISSAIGQHSYGTAGSWSLPRSSVRSRSTSSPKSDAEESGFVEVDIEGDEPYSDLGYGFISRGRTSAARDDFKDDDAGFARIHEDRIDEEEWDGELEMEM